MLAAPVTVDRSDSNWIDRLLLRTRYPGPVFVAVLPAPFQSSTVAKLTDRSTPPMKPISVLEVRFSPSPAGTDVAVAVWLNV